MFTNNTIEQVHLHFDSNGTMIVHRGALWFHSINFHYIILSSTDSWVDSILTSAESEFLEGGVRCIHFDDGDPQLSERLHLKQIT